MKITRRQFGLGVLSGIIAFVLGRFFGGCRPTKNPEIKTNNARARFWTRGDRLAG